MRSLLFASFCLILAACSSRHFVLPEQIHFKGEDYVVASHSQIDEMQQLLYLPQNSSQNPEDWQRGFLLFTDKNSAQKSLQERLTLRQKAFAQQASTQADLKIEDGELRSQVLYPPIERQPNYQLEVSRGRDLACGFGQMQFSDKRLGFAKNLQNLTALQAELKGLAKELAQMAWLIGCAHAS
ncbi:ABC transporter ATPase [Pasteurellaceae bacterium RH1A]|nr:ABC transporter ATPase [Pasteurellaceae bacterium RH1A]